MGGLEALTFDLDGTLIKTDPEYRYIIVGKTLKDLGVKAHVKSIDMFWFETGRSQVIRDCFGVDPAKFWELYIQYDDIELRKNYIKPYDDIDFIQEIRKNGNKTGIVTGAPSNIAALEISLLGEDNFDAIVIARSTHNIKPKPHPNGIDYCLKLLEITDKSKAVFIGNGEEDIIAGESAGVESILVDRGEYSFPHLKPSRTISSLYELRPDVGL